MVSCKMELALIGAMAAVMVTSAADSRVEFKDCPKCTSRYRVDVAANKAYVNLSRVTEQDREKIAALAVQHLDRARAPKDYDVSLCPLMGWSSWNAYAENINEETIVGNAKAMKDNGMQAAGYQYVNIDDGFMGGRDANGRLTFYAPRFPKGMKSTVDGIHALGFKAGIYSDAGSNTCCYIWGGAKGKLPQEMGTGLYGHDQLDFRLHFVETGFDFIKVDYCGAMQQKLDERKRYGEIAAAIKATGRKDIRFNVCRWAYPGTWISDIAGSWRVTGDIRANWSSVRQIIGESLYLSAYASPGHYNDMDMLEVGQIKGALSSALEASDSGFTDDEEIMHFGMWCMMSSPLVIGCGVKNMRPASVRLATNPYLIAMNQNRALGVQGHVVARHGEAYVLAKDADALYGKSRYVALYNANDREYEFRVDSAALELAGEINVFDLVDCSDAGRFEDHVYVKVPAHAAKFFRFDAEVRIERSVYEAEDAFLTEYQEIRDAKSAGTPYFAQLGRASGGVAVKGLGGRESNDLMWKDVRIVNGGKRKLEIYCESSKAIAFTLCVDDTQCMRLSMKSSQGSFVPVPVELELTPGVHKLRLSNAIGPLPDIDVMMVK